MQGVGGADHAAGPVGKVAVLFPLHKGLPGVQAEQRLQTLVLVDIVHGVVAGGPNKGALVGGTDEQREVKAVAQFRRTVHVHPHIGLEKDLVLVVLRHLDRVHPAHGVAAGDHPGAVHKGQAGQIPVGRFVTVGGIIGGGDGLVVGVEPDHPGDALGKAVARYVDGQDHVAPP